MFEPTLLSVFRASHRIIEPIEGPNDGMVSVNSSMWGQYKGTLKGVSHLDLINWSNRLRYLFWKVTGKKRKYVFETVTCFMTTLTLADSML